ncbi:MAG: EF-hand domain-containing protein [Polyangiales bacterium]
MHDLIRQKITHLFNVLDRNGDGHLDRSDFEQLADAYCRAFDVAPGSEAHHALHAQQLAGWELAVAPLDADGDGRVTLDEYLAGTGHLIAQADVFERFVIETARATLLLSDRDGDGSRDLAELTAQLGVHGASAAEAAESFSRLDRDGDGRVRVDELVDNTREYFGSVDPEARGNWILGPAWRRAAARA